MVASPLSFVVSGYNQHLTKRVEYLTIHGDDHIARLAFKKQERFWVGVGMFSVVMLVALTLSLALYFEDREVMLHGTYLFFGISLIVTLVSIAIFKPIWAFGRICAFFVWISELRAGPTLALFEQLPIQVRQAAQSRATALGVKADDRAMMKETLLVYEKNKARIEAHARDLEQSTPSTPLSPPHRRL